jgi:hypothetical protein
MASHFDEHADPVAASASLLAEATVLAARVRMLHEDLAAVDARIGAVSDALRRLQRDAARPGPTDSDDRHEAPE